MKYVLVILACGGVHLHKFVHKVLAHVLQPVQGLADGMKWVFVF